MNTRTYTGHQYGSYIVHEYNGMPQPTYDEQVMSLASSGWIWKQTVLRFSWPFSLFIPKTYCIEQDPYVWYWLTSLPCTFSRHVYGSGGILTWGIIVKVQILEQKFKKNGHTKFILKGQCRHRCISQHCAKTDCKDIPYFYVWHIAMFFSYFFYKNNPDRQQPIKEPSLKYYPFPLLSVSSLIRDHNIFLVGVFSVCFLL